MSVHQEVNHKTVDPKALPDLYAAREVMNPVSQMLWDLDNREGYKIFHDFWTNSTPTTGTRTMRVRHRYTPEVKNLIPKIHEILAQFKGQYKVYTYTNIWLLGDVGYDEFRGTLFCVTLYYRSQPRKKYEYA
jgi:hypothetical protein